MADTNNRPPLRLTSKNKQKYMEHGYCDCGVEITVFCEITEVERHTYFQLPVTFRTESDYPSYATHMLSGRRPGSNF